MTQHIFIVGSKGIPGNYGGYETFVDRLTLMHENNPKIKYHVACKAGGDGSGSISSDKGTLEYEYHNARCFPVKVPDIGPAQAIYYDVAAIRSAIGYIKAHRIERPIIYILACRIGPFMKGLVDKVHSLGGVVYINPDGHEWMRGKWSSFVRKYWKFSERLMVRYADKIVCDSINMEKYIRAEYPCYKPDTCYISYGAEPAADTDEETAEKLSSWLEEHGLERGGYYLIVGRFVPENNYETMLREFMASDTARSLAIITTANQKYEALLEAKLGMSRDPRIKFVGTVYDPALLAAIRKNAYGYLHGHEVGGTNPSLLEALAATDINLLLDVGFNREVGLEGALYWNKTAGNLSSLIEKADSLSSEEIRTLSEAAKKRISTSYSWSFIAGEYERLFNNI